ncbi:hypothetical protein [Mycobacterium sp. URHB0021]|jgi:hypothetical protein
MTTAVLDDAATVRDLLFGTEARGPAEALTGALHEHRTLSGLIPGPPGLTGVIEREVAAATDGLLSLNLADVAAAGWKKYEALRQAALRTRDAPATEEIVALATHRIESSHHPDVEVFIDGRSIATIRIELAITFSMAGVLAVVRQARLTAIRSGTCTITGSLTMQQLVVTKRQRMFDLPGAVRLRHGVPLLGPSTNPVSTNGRGSDPVVYKALSAPQSRR